VSIPVAARYKKYVCDRSLAGIAGSNPAGHMDVPLLYVCCMFVVSALCEGSITRSEESYRVYVCVCVCLCVCVCVCVCVCACVCVSNCV